MEIKGTLIQMSTYNQGTFIIESLGGTQFKCYCLNKEEDWDKLYGYLSEKTLTVDVHYTDDYGYNYVKIV